MRHEIVALDCKKRQKNLREKADVNQKIFVSAKEVADRAGRVAFGRLAHVHAWSECFGGNAATCDGAAEALGYHVNHLARGLMRNESGLVCLIVSEMDTPYRSSLIRAISHQLQAVSKIAMLINTDRSIKASMMRSGWRSAIAPMRPSFSPECRTNRSPTFV